MESTQTVEPQIEKPKVKASKEEAPKEKVVKESVALNGAKAAYVKAIRNATIEYEKLVDAELESVDVGHPHYGDLKFTKIRTSRVRFNMDELSRGKAQRA